MSPLRAASVDGLPYQNARSSHELGYHQTLLATQKTCEVVPYGTPKGDFQLYSECQLYALIASEKVAIIVR